MGRVHLAPGALVVLEGLDRSGKSTQRQLLASLDWSPPGPVFTHMPSGVKAVSEEIYRLTEEQPFESALSRQLLHLACHSENMSAIKEARLSRGLVLDRWWWSTVAYGWCAGHLETLGLSETAFFSIINTIWSQNQADLVFLFLTPYAGDDLNRQEVRVGYLNLADQHRDITVQVPTAGPSETRDFLIGELRSRGLLRAVG